MFKKFFLFLFFIFIASVLSAETLFTYKINNKEEIFTDKDLDIYLQDIPPQFRQFVVKDKNEFVKEIIFRKIASNEAKKLKIDNNPNIKKEIQAQAERILTRHFIDKKTDNIEIKDTEIQEFYDKHKNQFTKKAGFKFEKAVFNSEDEAKKAYEDISANKDFSKYATPEKANPFAAQNPDKYQLEAQIPKEILDTLNTLKKSEVSKPFKYSDKFVIVKLEDKRAEGVEPFDTVKSSIKNMLIQNKKQEALKALKEDLLNKYSVKASTK